MKKFLGRFFTEEAEVTDLGRRLVWVLILGYTLCLCYLCFSPQPFGVEGVETPNIHYLGRVPVLLVPFNSFVSIGKLNTLKKLFWVIGQNFSNTLLLTPLVMGFLGLFTNYRNWKLVLVSSFLGSLTIETTQVVLDLLFNSNRVFEIDDLIFNTLGGLIGLWLFPLVQYILKRLLVKK